MLTQTAKKLVKMSVLLGCVVFGSVSLNSVAAVITFGTGAAGYGGDISFVTPGGTDVQGTNINIGELTISGTSADGTYTVTDGLFNFSTATDTFSIQGTVANLGITNQTLLTGTTDDFSYIVNISNSDINFFNAAGPSTMSASVLNAVGLNLDTEFDYFGYSIYSNQLGEVTNSAVINTSVVPLPAAAWLFISAIAGLAGAKRLSRSKRTA